MASPSDGPVATNLSLLPELSLGHFVAPSERKFHLQLLLDHKEKELQWAGALGQRVLAQQIELEEKIRHIQDFDAERDDDDLDTEAIERYRELVDTIKAWGVENAQLSSRTFGPKAEDPLRKDLPPDEPDRSKTSSSSAAQSRRAKNAAHRADDVEFAFEIGSGLLTEVRRLQSLLGERDKAIQDMKEEKDDIEKSIDSLRTALRSQEQSSDKFKEENWNLEVTLQELRTQLSDSQSTAQRLESEHKRLTKSLNLARESADQHKNEAERTMTAFDEFRAKYDAKFAQGGPSLVGQPEVLSEALSTVLGIGLTTVIEGDVLDNDQETKDAECQTITAPLSDMSSQTDDVPTENNVISLLHRYPYRPVFTPGLRRTTLMQSRSSDDGREKERKEMARTSLTSDRSALSPRSSMSSDHNLFTTRGPTQGASATSALVMDQAGGATDPSIIHAITQAMIGEFLYKYTRRAIGKGYGEKRHKRFFWVHPYTKTLYWSSADPGSSNVLESSAKSSYIEGVCSVLDPNPMPPGLCQYSMVISTAQREMKITAPTKERHDIWLNALKYLLARPNPTLVPPPNQNSVATPMPHSVEFMDEDHRLVAESSPQSQRSGRSSHNDGGFNTTPRGARRRSQLSVKGSLGKRAGTPAVEYLRWAAPESPYSPSRSFKQITSGNAEREDELEFELHGETQSDDGFEGLGNVRACCDGLHTVGHQHHPHPHAHSHHGHLKVNGPARPVSPAWSLRPRTRSAHSHEVGETMGNSNLARDDQQERST